MERTERLASRATLVGLLRLTARRIIAFDDDSIELAIDLLDALDMRFDGRGGADLAGRDALGDLLRRETEEHSIAARCRPVRHRVSLGHRRAPSLPRRAPLRRTGHAYTNLATTDRKVTAAKGDVESP